MQSTGQTSRHASHPVQLSALITANSLGSFLRGPCLAITENADSRVYSIKLFRRTTTIIDADSLSAKDEISTGFPFNSARIVSVPPISRHALASGIRGWHALSPRESG